MDQSGNIQFQAGTEDVFGQFDMYLAEAVAIVLFLIEYTNEVDDRIHTFYMCFQLGCIKYIGFNQLKIWQYQQFTVIVPISGQDANAFAAGHQAGGYVFTYKSCTAKYAYRIVLHIKDL
jgi:hypothetical protein